jgi:PAS domain S-box-containing protein
MRAGPDSHGEEITRLHCCLNDLSRAMAVPASRLDGESSRIAGALLDALVGMLPVSFAFVRLRDSEGGTPFETMRVAETERSISPRDAGQALKVLLGNEPLKSPLSMRLSIGGIELSITSALLGLQGELGIVVVGSTKVDFPDETQSLLLDGAANRAALALQQARLLIATANDESERSERESWRIIDSNPGFIALLSNTGDVEMVNRHLMEYFGAPIEEIRQWGTNGMVHPEDLPDAAERFLQSIESGAPYESEHRLRRSDGVYRWFQSRGSPLRDANGHIVRWCWLLTDIDDRKRTEDALRASERNLKLIIDRIPAIAWSASTDGAADFFSQHYLDYVGMSLEQLKDWGWTAALHPDDLNGLATVWQRLMACGQAGEAEARLRRFDGAYRWFLFRANPLRDESGKIVKWYGTNLDIEDRKRREEDLRAGELSWREIVDSIPGFVVTMTAGGDVEFLNRQTLEYFGRTNSDLKNWTLIGVVHPDDLPRVIEARIKAIETGQIYDVEHRCRRSDGVYRWFQVRGLPVRNAEGAITAWYLLLTDIEDRKKAEAALRASERNLSLIINTIPTHIYVLNTEGSVQYVNHAVMEYTGLGLDDVKQEDYRDRVIHPEDLKGVRAGRAAALRQGAPFSTEQRVLGNDGQYRWFLVRYNPQLDEEGRIDRWYVAAFDIDDRKRAEAEVEQAYLRLAEAQRLSKTGSFITDLVADDHNWSEETFRIFEFDPASKVTVQRIRDLVHPDDLPSFEAVIARGMTGMDVDFVFRIVTARGAVKHVRGMARVMVQVAGRPLFIGALQDITDSKLAEEALDRARSELAHVARITTLNALTASIAHEINQPLSGIITNASTCLRMLNGDPPNIDGARETARRTLRDGDRASDVIKRLRVLFSKKEFALEQLDLNEATREVITLSLSDLQRNRVILRSELAEELPSVTGDRVQLQQVILNLLRNASDAMVGVDDRPRRLLIRTRREADDRVSLSVQDTGIGVNPQDLQRLFDAFYTTKSDGMGIGLSVSRSIIERHHGRLWAEPNDGPGATFSFSIPCGSESIGSAAPR